MKGYEFEEGLTRLQKAHGDMSEGIIEIVTEKYSGKHVELWNLMIDFLIENCRFKPKPPDFKDAFFKTVEKWNATHRESKECTQCGKTRYKMVFFRKKDIDYSGLAPCYECNSGQKKLQKSVEEITFISTEEYIAGGAEGSQYRTVLAS